MEQKVGFLGDLTIIRQIIDVITVIYPFTYMILTSLQMKVHRQNFIGIKLLIIKYMMHLLILLQVLFTVRLLQKKKEFKKQTKINLIKTKMLGVTKHFLEEYKAKSKE